MKLKLMPVPFDQLGKGICVASLCPSDKIRVDENPPIRAELPFRLLGCSYRRARDTNSGTLPSFPVLHRLPLRQTAAAEPKQQGELGVETRLCGYSIVTAEDMDGAAALAGECRAFPLGGGVADS